MLNLEIRLGKSNVKGKICLYTFQLQVHGMAYGTMTSRLFGPKTETFSWVVSWSSELTWFYIQEEEIQLMNIPDQRSLTKYGQVMTLRCCFTWFTSKQMFYVFQMWNYVIQAWKFISLSLWILCVKYHIHTCREVLNLGSKGGNGGLRNHCEWWQKQCFYS